MKNVIPYFLSVLLAILMITCDPWDLEKRADHDVSNGNEPDTCCNDDCDVDTCEGPEYITFDSLYGTTENDEARAVIITNDGGYAIVGHTVDPTDDDYQTYLLKIDSAGQKKWVLTYDFTDDDYGLSLTQLENNQMVVLGNLDTDLYAWQNLLMKTDASGVKQEHDDYGGDKWDIAHSFTPRTNNNGFMIIGYTETFVVNNLGIEAMIYTVDNNLSLVGTKKFEWAYDDYGYSVDTTMDNNYVVLVSKGMQDKTNNLHLIKLGQDQRIIWDEEIIRNARTVVGCVRTIPEGGYIAAGTVSPNRLRLVKTDDLGQNPVEETYDNVIADSSVTVIPTMDGGFAVLTSNLTLLKVDPDLKEKWTKEFEGAVYGNKALQQTADGGFILVGFTYNLENSSHDIRVIKTDPLGEIIHSR